MSKQAKPSSPKVSKPRSAKTPLSQPTNEDIARRAYEIYLERNGAPGNAFEDWTRAERELLDKPTKPRRKAAAKSIAA
jgi:hypothetical protein